VTYQITVTNQSSDEARNIDVRSVLPAHTDAKEENTGGFCDGTDSPFACNAGETIEFNVGDLPAGESAVVSYAAQVRTGEEAPPEGSVLDGNATASSFNGGGASASADVIFGTLDDGGDTIQIIEARNQGPGSAVTVEGTVTRAFGAYVRLQDGSGPTGASGLVIRQASDNSLAQDFRDDIANGNITQGTRLQVTGTLSEFAGLLQIDNEDLESYAVQEQGDLPSVQTVSLSDLQGSSGEDYESELLRVENLSFSNPETTDGTLNGGTTYQVENPSGATFQYRVQDASETAIIGAPIPQDTFTYEGVLGQFAFSGNDEGYQLIPVRVSTGLPVELANFDAVRSGSSVELRWQTASETNNAGFRVQRKAGEESGDTWTTVGSVDGSGTTSESKRYRYVDDNLPYAADRLTYRLRQVDTDGSSSFSKEVTVERSVTEVQLLGTYPNPVQQRATLRYAVPERQDVTIHLYDVLGRRVQTVVDGGRDGRHTTQLDVSRLASGVYFLRLTAGGQIRTQKLTVVH
jgi:hypothetical protein